MQSVPAESPVPAEGRPAHLAVLDYWRCFHRHRAWILGAAGIFAGVAVARAVIEPPTYTATAQIVIEREDPFVVSFRRVTEGAERGGEEQLRTHLRLVNNPSVARGVIERLQLLKDPDFAGSGPSPSLEGAVGRVRAGTEVETVRLTRLVMVRHHARRRELAIKLANAIAEQYVRYVSEQRYRTTNEAAVWLSGQIEAQTKKVEAAEMALKAAQAPAAFGTLEEERQPLDQRMRELNAAYVGARARRLEEEAKYAAMTAAGDPLQLAAVLGDPTAQKLRTELDALDRQLAQLREKYLDRHPEVVRVRAQIAVTHEALAAEAGRVVKAAETQYQAAIGQEQRLLATLEETRAALADTSRKAVSYDTARRELEASKTVLGSLMTRHQETTVARDLPVSNVRVVETATTAARDYWLTRLPRALLWGLAGALLASVLALLRERLDGRLHTPDDVRARLRLPLLTVVPEAPRAASGPLGPAAPALPAESFRLLRAVLERGGARTLAVTSTCAGEGKTLTAVHLARALSGSGRRVVLVDADLRNPALHLALGLDGRPGLGDALAGTVAALSAVQPAADGRLGLLAAGENSASTIDLLDRERMEQTLRTLASAYDYVVIDTPPAGAVADALVVAPLAQATVLVVRAEATPDRAVVRTHERLSEAGARVAGVVLNRARLERGRFDHAYEYEHAYATSPVSGQPAVHTS